MSHPVIMRMSKEGIDFLQAREGWELKMYKDSAGLPTIGVGHLLTQSELTSGKIYISRLPIIWRDGMTESEVKELLEQDLQKYENAVRCAVLMDLKQHQYDALVSFVFNVGETAFKNSTLLRKLNAGQIKEIPAQLARWNWSGGKVINGLTKRREMESRLFTEGEYA
ncbi:lysozyme [Solemya velum gill symbiont]|nr:lysozyme [Solemya velum gill symbiont]OOY45153.1 hypothetical protein BOV93_13575 [Solemya velum gill symbiont]OOZ10477.1 hypothetical protein BOW25_13080 [Solemya velum gill symbiont]